MITKADVTQAEIEERLSEQLYYRGLVDFTKWTSTLAIAGVLWVGGAITRTIGLSQALMITSSVVLVISLIFAIVLMRRVLQAWGKEWVRAIEHHTFLLTKQFKAFEPEQVTAEKESDQINRLISAIDATREFSRPSGFNAMATSHIAFLVLGLFLYIIAQALSVL